MEGRPWHALISRLDPLAEWHQPADAETIATAEAQLRATLPSELRSLLLESDGVEGRYGLRLIWPIAMIAAENKRLRGSAAEQYMRLDTLLFFADAGDGELFGHPVTASGLTRERVFVWNPIEDSRILVAASLTEYLGRWLDGSLKL